MSAADRERWDARYAGPDYRMGAGPKAWLAEVVGRLPPRGRALDLASGEGQNAVFLAERGWDVDALDVSPVGLAKARALAEARGVAVHWHEADLEALPPFPRPPYDLVTCFHYWQPTLASAVVAALSPGGWLVTEVLGHGMAERHPGMTRAFLAPPGALEAAYAGLEVVASFEGWRGEVFVARLLARRR